MLQELQPEPFIPTCALNNPRQISQQYLRVVHELRVANVGAQGREWVVAYLRESSG